MPSQQKTQAQLDPERWSRQLWVWRLHRENTRYQMLFECVNVGFYNPRNTKMMDHHSFSVSLSGTSLFLTNHVPITCIFKGRAGCVHKILTYAVCPVLPCRTLFGKKHTSLPVQPHPLLITPEDLWKEWRFLGRWLLWISGRNTLHRTAILKYIKRENEGQKRLRVKAT